MCEVTYLVRRPNPIDQAPESLRVLAENILSEICDDTVELKFLDDGAKVQLEAVTTQRDIAKVIGRGGSNARAIRMILYAAAKRNKYACSFNVREREA